MGPTCVSGLDARVLAVFVLAAAVRWAAGAPSCASVEGPQEVMVVLPPATLAGVCTALNASSGICCNYFGWCGTSCHVPVAAWPGGAGTATLPAGTSRLAALCGDGLCTSTENCTTCVVDCGFCQVPGVVSRCPVENLTAPVMALTFTDGPMPGVTNRLLDLLSELKVVATFFPTGTSLGDADANQIENRALVLRAQHEGHSIASRGYGRLPYQAMPLADVHDDVLIAEMLLASLLCVKVKNFRPPFNQISNEQQALVEGLGYRIISANVDAMDWKFSKSGDVVANVEAQLDALFLGPGIGRRSVIATMSDSNAVSLGAVEGIVRAARTRGYQFVPMEYCLYSRNCSACPSGVNVFESGLPGLNGRCYKEFPQDYSASASPSVLPIWTVIVISIVGVVFTCGCLLALSQCRRKDRSVRDEIDKAMVRPGRGATKAEVAVWERHHGTAPGSRTVMGQKDLRTKLRAAGTASLFIAVTAPDGARKGKRKLKATEIRVIPAPATAVTPARSAGTASAGDRKSAGGSEAPLRGIVPAP